MRSTHLKISAIAILATASGLHAAEGPAPSAPRRDDPIRVLIITGGHEFEREEFFSIFDDHPDITWFEGVQFKAQRYFAAPRRDDYDVMVWYDMVPDIAPSAQRDLVDLLEEGKPLVALHHSIATYSKWPETINILGGRYNLGEVDGKPGSTFKHDVDVDVKIADASHPITVGMDDFTIHDEVYKSMVIQPDVKPLLTTDHPDSDKLIGWTHRYGNSPVAYLQGGHDAKAFANPNYQRLVVQAIRWAAGRLPDPSEEGFKPLFNGKDLDGWTVMGDPKGFKVSNGILRSDLPYTGDWLRTNKLYSDFVLRLDWRVSPEGNSGVFVRSAIEGHPWISGSEIQITSIERDLAHCTGSLYGSVAVNPRPDESPNKWHRYEIHCQGPHYQVFADNIPVVDVDARKVPPLYGRPMIGYVGVQDNHSEKGWIEYRNIRIKELKMASGDETPWKLGTQTYTFRLYSLFEAIDKAKQLGLHYIEAYPGQTLSPDQPDVKVGVDMSPEIMDQVKRKLAESNVTLVNFGVVIPKNDEADCRKLFEFARLMGIQTITAEPEPAAMDLLDKLTQEYDINIAIHNHPKPSRYWNPDTVLEACEGRNPRIGACADTGHWLRSGLDPIECLKKLEGRIISSHFKDLNKAEPSAHDVPWGTGVGNVEGVLKELARQKFEGVFSVEYEHDWDKSMPDIDAGLKYFRKTAEKLGYDIPVNKTDQWKLSVQTYTFNRFTLFEAIDKAASLGLDYIEGYEWQKVSPEHGELKLLDAPDEVLDAVKARMADAGITMTSFYSSTIGGSDEHTAKAFALAKKLGAGIIVCEPQASVLPEIDRQAEKHDMRIAIHNHPLNPREPGYENWKPEKVMAMIADLSPRVGTCADVGHWSRSGVDPVEALKAYEGRLISLHLKDVNSEARDAQDVIWGNGVSRFKDVLAELDRQDFEGVIAIEYEHNWENNVPDIAQCIAAYEKTAGAMGYH